MAEMILVWASYSLGANLGNARTTLRVHARADVDKSTDMDAEVQVRISFFLGFGIERLQNLAHDERLRVEWAS